MKNESSTLLSALPHSLQWIILIGGGALAGYLLHYIGLPAALFLGPMIVAVCMGVAGSSIHVPRLLFRSGQGIVGLMVAQSVTLGVLLAMVAEWHLMLIMTIVTLVLSAAVGLGMIRFGGIPASAAAWGTAPGAASAMIAMAEEDGADGRLVACMQYVRVVCVVMLGAWISHMVLAPEAMQPVSDAADVPLSLIGLAATLLVAFIGALSGRFVPSGALLTPVLLGSALQLLGWLDITLTEPILALAYGAIGSYIGLRFDRATVLRVAKLMPTVITANLALILLTTALAWPISWIFSRDFLSVFLAISPGGLDAMAIIAVETSSDASFVVALQTLRLIGVVLTGKLCAQALIALSRRLKA